MPYWRQFFHLVWATKERQHFITPEIEPHLYRVMSSKCREMRSLAIEINGMPDHVHVIAAIPPSVLVANVVKNMKGTSSRFVHKEFGAPFEWQPGYGSLTISRINLKQAIAYVRRQKERHANNKIFRDLERTTDEDDGPSFINLESAPYL
jgi:putative transposase